MRVVRDGWKARVAWLLLALWLTGCGSGVPAAGTAMSPPAATPSSALAATVRVPSPAPSVVSSAPTATTAAVSTEPAESPPFSSALAGVPLSSGWTHYLGIYLVNDVAFGADRVAWATDGGVLVWDWQAEAPARYTAVGDGLGSDFATDVAIAPDGSVWVATLGGVSHLVDGTWITYTAADGLAGDAPQTIEATAEGVVWVGTTEGISRYVDGVWTSFLPGTRAWKIGLGPDGSVWFAGDEAGLIRYQPGSDTWTTYLPEGDALPEYGGTPGVKTVGVDPQGNPWVYLGYDHVYRVKVDDAQAATWERMYDAGGQWVCGIDFSMDGTPWLATCDGYHAYGAGLVTREAQGGEWRHLGEAQGFPSLNVLSVKTRPAAAGKEQVWVGTDRGLGFEDGDGRWQAILGGGLVSNHVTAVATTPLWAEDGQSIAWFGFGAETQPVPGGGVSRFDPAAPDTAEAGEWWHLLGEANVQVLATAPDGSTWAGAGCRVYHLDKAVTPKELLADPDWPLVADCDTWQGNVLDFAFEPDGSVWAATGLNLVRFDGAAWQVYDRMVHTVAVEPAGDLWVSGWEGTQGSEYVARYEGETWTKVLDRRLGSLVATPDGEVWGLAGEQGVARFDGQAWTWYDAVEGRSLSTVSALATAPAADGSGTAVWVAGAGALFRFEEDAWTVYALPAAVAGVAIEDMAVGADGTIWLATSRGALAYRPQSLQ